ncbi:ATP synthase delta chain, chloroplastic-like [Zingiber officinale]|uniref:Uncharacterized protein n=1 Tax=Zingiber officinale TaxID=94328 RepID=A0A8J5HI81_ZINOF|nr:ATP synthase delta chain, chloroplastic-like [Zingiber officinale]KAG6527638.1 hypothetical protein ZIOFF_009763 [Zingiber officinale]
MNQSISASRHPACPMALPAHGASSLKTYQVSSRCDDREDTSTCNLQSRPVKVGNISICSGVSFSLFPPSFMPDFKKNDKLIAEIEEVAGLNSFIRPPVDDLVVCVSSAVKLDGRQIDLIARKMRRLTGFRKLRLENAVDPSLIAGFVISYCDDGSQVIDLSVKGKLDALAARLESSDKKSTGSIVGDFLACGMKS